MVDKSFMRQEMVDKAFFGGENGRYYRVMADKDQITTEEIVNCIKSTPVGNRTPTNGTGIRYSIH